MVQPDGQTGVADEEAEVVAEEEEADEVEDVVDDCHICWVCCSGQACVAVVAERILSMQRRLGAGGMSWMAIWASSWSWSGVDKADDRDDIQADSG